MTSFQIVSALFMLAMFIVIFPRAKYMLKNSPKGTMQDWMGFIVPIGAVVLFVILLISIV